MKKENFENYEFITTTVLPRHGVGGVFDKKLETEMDKGVSVIQLKAEKKFDENKMEYTFRLEKSENDNRYYLNRVDATLTTKNGEVQNQLFRIYNQRGFDVDQMFNLMEGRYVHKEYFKNGVQKSGWSGVDHNRKDDDGNSIIRTFSDELTKFNVVVALGKIPTGYMNQTDKEAMIAALKNGDPVTTFVKMPDGTREKASLVVQPQLNAIFAYDKDGKKINFETKQSKVVAVDDEKKVTTAGQILEQSMNGEQGQGKGNKIK